ncbi:MAG: ABC transporter ATP-binding protein [Myxococcota bacterium]
MSAAAPAAAVESPAMGQAVAHALRRLSVYIRRNRGFYGLCIATILAYNAAFVAVPRLVGWAITAAELGLGRDEITRRCGWLVAVVVVGALTRYFSRTLVFNAAREIEYEIRNDLFAQLQRLPQSFYASWRTGDLMSRCVNDLNSVRLMLGPGFLSIVQTPLMFALVFGTMAYMDPLLAGLVLLPYPAFVFIARAFGRSLHQRSLAMQEGLADLSNQVQESVAGISVVKAYAMEDVQARRFGQDNDALLDRHLRLVRVNGGMPAITSLLPALAMFVVLLVGGQRLESGSLGVGEFFTFAMYIFQLTFPTFIMGWVVALVQRGAAAMQRIDEILSVTPSIRDRDDVVSVGELRGEIEFRGLSVRHETGRDEALRDIHLSVPAGTTLGVVGPVGSGKTTLASAVPRLLELEDGQLFIDGIDVNRLPLAALRRQIAMVPQDAFLFSMSLADNVAFGAPDADRAAVEEAARRAQLHKDVAELPGGYDTLVGERGVMLSGGQRQRTALARALVLSPRILILDDTLSAVDAETEAAIQAELRRVFAGRTVIVVASRVSTVQDCDRIALLDGGRLVDLGSHAELMAHSDLYARLAAEEESGDGEATPEGPH